jgi:hypothetical protein
MNLKDLYMILTANVTQNWLKSLELWKGYRNILRNKEKILLFLKFT